MTRYTVVWADDARGELADLWVASPDRNGVSSAADTADQLLATDAATRGSELSEGLYCLKLPPLKVIFLIREDDRIVEVLMVHKL